jgi:hypothetical protein
MPLVDAVIVIEIEPLRNFMTVAFYLRPDLGIPILALVGRMKPKGHLC